MQLAWVTDIHLNFVDSQRRGLFLELLAESADAVVISGDVGESHDVAEYLVEMARFLQRPIYFVLGNHDFYRSSIAATREAVAQLAADTRYLEYLTARGVIELNARTALIGHDGWADARLGDFADSDVILNDYALIDELRCWLEDGVLDKARLRAVLHHLGDEAAGYLERTLDAATARYPRVIAVTHVPPFREATWHEGHLSDDNYLPHFSCGAVGEVLLRTMRARPQAELLVLCGHTHSAGEAQLLPNLQVRTGGARYGLPAIQQVFSLN